MIFFIYVQAGYGTMSDLLPVYSVWEEAIVDTVSIWQVTSSSGTPPPSRFGLNVCTLDHFARAISRTRKKAFELTINLCDVSKLRDHLTYTPTAKDRSKLAGCHSLTLVESLDVIEYRLKDMLEVISDYTDGMFSSLQRLVLKNLGRKDGGWNDLDAFLQSVEESAPALYRLEIIYDEFPAIIATRILKYNGILGRLKELKLTITVAAVPWRSLPKLTHLDVTSLDAPFIHTTDLSDLVVRRLRSLCLEGRFKLPSSSVFHQLQHLVLRRFTKEQVERLRKTVMNKDENALASLEQWGYQPYGSCLIAGDPSDLQKRTWFRYALE